MICTCSISKRLTGDGCEACNPALALDHAKETITDLKAEVAEKDKRIAELEAGHPVLEGTKEEYAAEAARLLKENLDLRAGQQAAINIALENLAREFTFREGAYYLSSLEVQKKIRSHIKGKSE